jgi:hypothetical protein
MTLLEVSWKNSIKLDLEELECEAVKNVSGQGKMLCFYKQTYRAVDQ